MRHFVILLVYAMCLLPTKAIASGAGVSPAWVDTAVVDGRANRFKISVRNTTEGMLTFDATIGDLWYDPQTMRAVFPPPGTSPMSGAPLLEVFPQRLSVPPGEIASFTMTYAAPAGLDESRFAIASITSVPYRRETETMRAAPVMRFVVPILLAPSQSDQRGVRVGEVETYLPTDESIELAIGLPVENTGRVHERAQYQYVIRSATDGRIVTTMQRQAEKFLLPGQSRVERFEVASEIPPGEYEIVGVVRYGRTGAVTFQQSFAVPAEAESLGASLGPGDTVSPSALPDSSDDASASEVMPN